MTKAYTPIQMLRTWERLKKQALSLEEFPLSHDRGLMTTKYGKRKIHYQTFRNIIEIAFDRSDGFTATMLERTLRQHRLTIMQALFYNGKEYIAYQPTGRQVYIFPGFPFKLKWNLTNIASKVQILYCTLEEISVMDNLITIKSYITWRPKSSTDKKSNSFQPMFPP